MTTVKADLTAADRLLKAAVRKAREQIAAADVETIKTIDGQVVRTIRSYQRAAVVEMLTEAGRSAELLIGGGRRG